MRAPLQQRRYARAGRLAADGTKQVTYNGAPLCSFRGDQAAGDTTGQGLNDVWFVAAP